MPLIFSPLNESVLGEPPKKLLPKHAFVMRQIGDPPKIDLEMSKIIIRVFKKRGFNAIDATASVGAKDYLERILGLIRGTGFTVAVFSSDTRSNSLANIALELGYAAMCGKPLIITQSKGAHGPSDLKRTDWIEYNPDDREKFQQTLEQALNEIETYLDLESDLLEAALKARNIDCAIAFERANKAFLLSGDRRFIEAASSILEKLKPTLETETIADLDRLRQEIDTFILQANRSIEALETTANSGARAKTKPETRSV